MGGPHVIAGWVSLAVLFAGWAYGSRLALHALMNRRTVVGCRVVDSHGYTVVGCTEYHDGRHVTTIGATRDRNALDGLAALLLGLTWPILIPAVLLTRTTPRTPDETTRRLHEQAATIDRLTRQIGDR